MERVKLNGDDFGAGRAVTFFLAAAILAACCPVAFAGEAATNPAIPSVNAEASAVTVSNENELAYDQIELLTEVILIIRKHYVKEKSYSEIVNGALHGMLEALDPHSAYMEPEVFKDMQDETAGFYGGIGIHIGMRDGFLTVVAPIEDTPAFNAGIQSGDRILKINGEKTTGVSLKDAVRKLRGEKGSEVTVTVSGANEDKQRDVSMIRDDIELPSVKGARLVRNGVGYVRITEFKAPTAESLLAAVKKLQSEGMTALILDLRGNPGGLLKTAAEVAQMFLDRGKLIVSTRGRDSAKTTPGWRNTIGLTAAADEPGDSYFELKAVGKVHMTDFPMAVLVNGGSASASEIVAGALQDHKRAVLIGDTTYGKGSVQSVIKLRADDDAAIRLTTALYYTPAGRQIHEKGIEPDIPVPVSREDWRRVQIRRAHVETPKQFTEDETGKYADVVDVQTERAVDLLQALQTFK